jgi:hypothetical protein
MERHDSNRGRSRREPNRTEKEVKTLLQFFYRVIELIVSRVTRMLIVGGILSISSLVSAAWGVFALVLIIVLTIVIIVACLAWHKPGILTGLSPAGRQVGGEGESRGDQIKLWRSAVGCLKFNSISFKICL